LANSLGFSYGRNTATTWSPGTETRRTTLRILSNRVDVTHSHPFASGEKGGARGRTFRLDLGLPPGAASWVSRQYGCSDHAKQIHRRPQTSRSQTTMYAHQSQYQTAGITFPPRSLNTAAPLKGAALPRDACAVNPGIRTLLTSFVISAIYRS